MANVAARAKVERSTLYRRFPDRWSAIIEALLAKAEDIVPTRGESLIADLTEVLVKLAEVLDTPLGAATLAVAAEGSSDDVGRRFSEQRMTQLEPLFDVAIKRGELRADVDGEALLAMLAGPLWYRRFMIGKPVDRPFIDQVVASVAKTFSPTG